MKKILLLCFLACNSEVFSCSAHQQSVVDSSKQVDVFVKNFTDSIKDIVYRHNSLFLFYIVFLENVGYEKNNYCRSNRYDDIKISIKFTREKPRSVKSDRSSAQNIAQHTSAEAGYY